MAAKKFDFTKKENGAVQGHAVPSAQAQSAVLSLFTGGTALSTDTGHTIADLSLALIDSHPQQERWSMNEDELNWLANNIAQVGVLEPVQVMRKTDGRYLLLAGHRRCEASRRAGLQTVPALVSDYDEDRATIVFNATNLGQREKLLPSEKAFAYCDLAAAVGENSTSAIAQLTGDNIRQIQRYKRLTLLQRDLLLAVDSDDIPTGAGEMLSYLTPREQDDLLVVLQERGKIKLSLQQASRLKLLAANALCNLTAKDIDDVLFRAKLEKPNIVKLSTASFLDLLPETHRDEQSMTAYIRRALEAYAQQS